MKNFKATLFLLVTVLSLAIPTHAQTMLLPTTLSAAIPNGSTHTVIVASATTCIVGNLIMVDRELMEIQSVASTTLYVRRGTNGTVGVGHVSAAAAVCSVPQAFGPSPNARADALGNPVGSCTRANQLYLPVFNAKAGTVNDCLGGFWTSGDSNNGAQFSSKFRIEAPAPGSTAYTSLGTDTALSATTMYCTEVFLPTNKLLTGIGILNGATVTGDLRFAILYDSAGNALANSATTGIATVTANVYEQQAFTQKYVAIGPQTYFACVQNNAVGATTARLVATGTNANLLTKGQTSSVFGTIAALVPPTTFTTVVGAYVYLY